ncbi:hypothetical protein GCM10010185_15940 [Saccharothrix coeruleofusca]|uniref:Transposase n=1 Tax=Saccharothrix coeruleofusca TaxID=33919 RepID=A0A918ALF7_9PSEU|nr:hypothetical protein [Saccharothrix coeruleofusca]MBP2333887.1 IS30 family transposase [Saccharothrix coeruleofusca]GGP44970.1 hypothetical protein GCM10010185_15940 [Saccharothrix coeruleofusca]
MALPAEVAATGLPVFFAHPHFSWECGGNDKLNRIVRKFLPKCVDVPSDLRYLAADINDRPYKIHDWRKPGEVFTELLDANSSIA